MKAFKFLRLMVMVGGILLSACTAAPSAQVSSSAKEDKGSSEAVFTGVIEAVNGDQLTINGQTFTIDPSLIQESAFVAGDTIKVEAQVEEDGSVTIRNIESLSEPQPTEAVNSTPDPVSTEAPGMVDDRGLEAKGTVEAITSNSVTVSGQTYVFAPGAEVKGSINVGTVVKLEFLKNADGSLSVRQLMTTDPAQITSDHSQDDSNGTSVSDDPSGDDHAGADPVNHDSGDDHGGSSNDDISNDNSGNG